MSSDRKLSVLESLLERVRSRAAGPRVAASALAPREPRLEGDEAVKAAAASPGTPAPPPAAPAAIRLEPPPAREEIVSEPPAAEADEDQGPPSAPRLREGIVDEEEQAQDHEFQEDEGPIKTPPPESGRQHVASPVPPEAQEADDLDMDIAITVTDASPEPPAAASAESAPPAPAPVPPPVAPIDLVVETAGPLPRLAFVSEPEIELHVGRPPAPRAEEAPTSAVIAIPTGEPAPEPVPAMAPAPEPVAASAAPAPEPAPLPEPERVAAPPPPPVRLMAQPAADGPSAAPVEVWASTHAPAALRGQVASFVGQNVAFAPKSFGELLDASLALGES